MEESKETKRASSKYKHNMNKWEWVPILDKIL